MKPTNNFNFGRKFLALLVKANYHEYRVLDKNGEVIGYEFYTTRGNKVIRIMNKDGGKDEHILEKRVAA